MSYLCYLCLFEYSGVRHILCCVFVLFFFVLRVLPVFLDCPFIIASSVFFYLITVAIFKREQSCQDTIFKWDQ
jgi:hypothetical protein